MKNTNFYPSVWQTLPFSLDLATHWDAQGKCTQDLTLENSYATKHYVAEMNLNITGLAAIDLDGKPHAIEKFETQNTLNLKGLSGGHYIKTKEELNLRPGRYKALRFYLDELDNTFVFGDKSSQAMYGFKYLDFNINGELVVANNPLQLVLRFNFSPLKRPSIIYKLKHIMAGLFANKLDKSYAN